MLSQCEQAENTMRKKKPKSLKMVAICAFVRKLFNRHSLEKLALNFALKQQAPIMKKIQLNFIGASKPSPIGANQVTLDFIAQKITLLLTKSPIMLQNIFDDGLFKKGRF